MLSEEALSSAGIQRADAEVLLAAILKKDRTQLFAHPEQLLTNEEEKQWKDFSARRRGGEPVAYILGEKEFYGRRFFVDPRVLIPRPATEGLIDAALRFLDDPQNETAIIDAGIVAVAHALRPLKPTCIVDIGTGSGCIAITLKVERPDLRLCASDSSEDALAVAQENAKRLGADIEFRQGRGLEPFADLQQPFLIVSNPPYIPEGITLQKDVADFEPHQALFAGKEGRDVLMEIAREAKENSFCAGFIFECREEQASVIRDFID